MRWSSINSYRLLFLTCVLCSFFMLCHISCALILFRDWRYINHLLTCYILYVVSHILYSLCMLLWFSYSLYVAFCVLYSLYSLHAMLYFNTAYDFFAFLSLITFYMHVLWSVLSAILHGVLHFIQFLHALLYLAQFCHSKFYAIYSQCLVFYISSMQHRCLV